MPSDASIYGMLQQPKPMAGPLDQFGSMLQLKHLMNQNELAGLQRGELERGIDEERRIRDLFARGDVKPEDVMAISPKRGMEFKKSHLDSQKSAAELAKTQAETQAKNVQILRDMTVSVQNDAMLGALRERTAQLYGPQVAAQIPQSVSDPNFASWQTKAVMDSNAFLDRASPKPPAGHKVRPDGTLSEVDPNYLKGREAIAKAGATNVKVPVNLAGNRYAETVGTKAGERDITQHESAQAAVENLAKLNMLSKHLKDSSAITGMGAEFLRDVERAKQLVMASEQSGKKVSDTELLDTFLGSDVFPMIKALGVGARGLDTPAEREFLRSVMTGTITMNKDTLQRMTEIRRDIAKRAVEKWNQRVESGELDRYFEFTQSKKGKLDLPREEPTAVQPKQFTPEQIDAELRRRGVAR